MRHLRDPLHRTLIVVAFAGLSVFVQARGKAEAVIYSATGLTPADLQPVMDQFRADIGLGGVNNGDLTGRFTNGWREVTWEESAIDVSYRNYAYFQTRGLAVWGYVFGITTDVSDLNPTYSTAVKPFSGDHMLLEETLGIAFFDPVPQFPTYPAGVSAFGAVFIDVDLPETVRLVFRGDSPVPLGSFAVPASPGDSHYSFLGVRFDQGERASWLYVDSNAHMLPAVPGFPDDGSVRENGNVVDIFGIDDFIYAEPQVPEPGIALMMTAGGLILAFALNCANRRPFRKLLPTMLRSASAHPRQSLARNDRAENGRGVYRS